MTIDDNEWMALARYAAGECSPEEREAMRRWIAENEERARLAFELGLIGRATVLDKTEWNTNAAWERLTVRAGTPQAPPSRARSGRVPTILHSRSNARESLAMWGIAATILFAAGGAYVLRERLMTSPTAA